MKISVTKEFQFDAAHLLPWHSGLCKNLHGHTYKLFVTAEKEYDSQISGPNMVVDFKDLKKLINELIVDKFDHAVIIDIQSKYEVENALLSFAEKFEIKIARISGSTTCENMVRAFSVKLKDISKDFKISKIVLYETPTSFAEVNI